MIGVFEMVLHVTGGVRFVVICSTKPAAFVGQVKVKPDPDMVRPNFKAAIDNTTGGALVIDPPGLLTTTT